MWREDSTESSSSVATERSTPPKDVLELGRYLVDELLKERTTDTLARWLIHSVAQRLTEIDEAKDPVIRKHLEVEASEIILKIWTHRSVLPGRVDPLAKYSRALSALRTLIPGGNPWQAENVRNTDRLAASLYETLSNLTLSLLMIGLSDTSKRSEQEKKIHELFLPTDQNAVLLQLEEISGNLSPIAVSNEVPNSSPEPYESVRELVANGTRLLQKISSVLDQLAAAQTLESSDSEKGTRAVSASSPKQKGPPKSAKSSAEAARKASNRQKSSSTKGTEI